MAMSQNPYPGSGPGPIPDITDWQPHAHVAAGAQLVIQGRNLMSASFVAMIGSNSLPLLNSAPGELHFQVPPTLRISGAPLVVYQQGGQVRSLEPSYIVADPTPSIAGVVPTGFGQGDVVTVCGTNLFQVSLRANYLNLSGSVIGIPPGSTYDVSTTPLSNGAQILPANFVTVGDKAFQVINPQTSASGDRLMFVVGDLYRPIRYGVQGSLNPLLIFVEPMPSVQAGALGVNVVLPTNQVITVGGPTVYWQKAGVKFTGVSNGFANAPFTLSAAIGPHTQTVLPILYFSGSNFDNATYTMGGVAVPSAGTEDTGPRAGQLLAYMPASATTGPFCGTKNGITNCYPQPIFVAPSPVLTQLPTMPMPLFTEQTIQGLHLTMTGVAGLQQAFTVGSMECNIPFRLISYTDQKIVFRFGDPGQTVDPACVAHSALFQPQNNYHLHMQTLYNGQLTGWDPFDMKYYLKAP
jgi:hypothetical protein